jgi:hypothetical protein
MLRCGKARIAPADDSLHKAAIGPATRMITIVTAKVRQPKRAHQTSSEQFHKFVHGPPLGHPINGMMEHPNETTTEGQTAARAIELAQKARLARRAAVEFMRRWAVEQTVENVGLVALSTGLIDLPCKSHEPQLESNAALD